MFSDSGVLYSEIFKVIFLFLIPYDSPYRVWFLVLGKNKAKGKAQPGAPIKSTRILN